MGKPTGFLEFARQDRGYEKPDVRRKSWKEFVKPLPDPELAARRRAAWIAAFRSVTMAARQQSDPDWNNLVQRGSGRRRSGRCIRPTTSPNSPPDLPGALRGVLHPQHRRQPGHHQDDRMRHRRSRLAGGLDPAAAAGAPDREERRRGRLRPAGLACASSWARRPPGRRLREERPDRRLLRYGIPDFKMEKWLIDRRVEQMAAEGVEFVTGVEVGAGTSVDTLLARHDALVMAAAR